jgi:hypothetical protein
MDKRTEGVYNNVVLEHPIQICFPRTEICLVLVAGEEEQRDTRVLNMIVIGMTLLYCILKEPSNIYTVVGLLHNVIKAPRLSVTTLNEPREKLQDGRFDNNIALLYMSTTHRGAVD